MNKCPYKDYEGNDIYEGDEIFHPSGEVGIVIYNLNADSDADSWLVDYGDSIKSRLCLQVGDRGMARVVPF